MVFIQRESTGRSGEPSRLRDKLLLFNARTRLSQQGVASFVGVSTAALRNWEAGQSKPTAQNLKRLIELSVAYRAFAEGEERTQAAELWEAAQERGLKVPFDEQWFQELLANQRSLHQESEREYQPEQQHEHDKATKQELGAEASDDPSSTQNKYTLPTQSPEALSSSSTHKLSRRTVVVEGGVLPDKTTTLHSELFNPTEGIWRNMLGSLKEARAKHTATLLPNGAVLVTGGSGPLQKTRPESPRLSSGG